MKTTNLSTILRVVAFSAAGLLGLTGSAALAADTIDVTYLGAGVNNPSSITSYYETFTSATAGDNTSSFMTNFNGSPVMGTYTGSFAILSADKYGGADGTGQYISTSEGFGTGSYTLTLSTGVNYFGYWLSALDAGNQVQLEDSSGNVLYTFTPQDLIDSLGTCQADPGYCGNPTGTYAGQNSDQQYAYVNFYDATGSDISKIVYTETIVSAGYESDNHAVANLGSAPGGTPLGQSPTVTPEPSSLLLMGTGLFGGVAALRRRRSATAA